MTAVEPRPSSDENLKVCPTAHAVAGLDVSHWDGRISWNRVRESSNYFVFVKASEGATYRDATFTKNWRDAKSEDMLRGAYHFFRPRYDGASQAALFLRTVGNDIGELPCVLDFEAHDGVSNKMQLGRALEWLNFVERATGRKPIVYASPGFINDLGNPQKLFEYPLWLAHYGVACPRVPPPWHSWTFWQDSESGRIPGVSTSVDINVFNGSLADLEAFAGKVPG